MHSAKDNLASINGNVARLWKFTSSHDQLVYEVLVDGSQDNIVMIVFVGCESIATPVAWTVSNPIVSTFGDNLRLTDDKVELIFKDVYLFSRAEYEELSSG